MLWPNLAIVRYNNQARQSDNTCCASGAAFDLRNSRLRRCGESGIIGRETTEQCRHGQPLQKQRQQGNSRSVRGTRPQVRFQCYRGAVGRGSGDTGIFGVAVDCVCCAVGDIEGEVDAGRVRLAAQALPSGHASHLDREWARVNGRRRISGYGESSVRSITPNTPSVPS